MGDKLSRANNGPRPPSGSICITALQPLESLPRKRPANPGAHQGGRSALLCLRCRSESSNLRIVVLQLPVATAVARRQRAVKVSIQVHLVSSRLIPTLAASQPRQALRLLGFESLRVQAPGRDDFEPYSYQVLPRSSLSPRVDSPPSSTVYATSSSPYRIPAACLILVIDFPFWALDSCYTDFPSRFIFLGPFGI
ncbi:hypothetical protein TgHK011_008957 [Trichoderma gracile]|nr:hypothetical protein TgHK011_008957 [Trichoderma gracile]